LPASTEQRIVEIVEGLAETPFPHGMEKLSGTTESRKFKRVCPDGGWRRWIFSLASTSNPGFMSEKSCQKT
jgi:hypothetical protein